MLATATTCGENNSGLSTTAESPATNIAEATTQIATLNVLPSAVFVFKLITYFPRATKWYIYMNPTKRSTWTSNTDTELCVKNPTTQRSASYANTIPRPHNQAITSVLFVGLLTTSLRNVRISFLVMIPPSSIYRQCDIVEEFGKGISNGSLTGDNYHI